MASNFERLSATPTKAISSLITMDVRIPIIPYYSFVASRLGSLQENERTKLYLFFGLRCVPAEMEKVLYLGVGCILISQS